MAGKRAFRAGIGVAAFALLSGCMEGAQLPGFLTGPEPTATTAPRGEPRVVERDVEAPEVFDLTAEGLWDGRPSLGGVWVAHAAVTDPERVVIRNTETGQTVNGALFRRERANPGPPIQVSAEAAAALGLLAGQPAELQVVALRRVEVTIEPDPVEAPAGAAAPGPDDIRPRAKPGAAAAPAAPATEPAGAAITSEPLDPLAAATEAVEKAEAAQAGGLERPWLQVGMYSTEANAQVAAERLTAVETPATVAGGTYKDAPIWRVLIGPAEDRAAMRALIEKAEALGYTDAYPVVR